jgi:hypothetical protein
MQADRQGQRSKRSDDLAEPPPVPASPPATGLDNGQPLCSFRSSESRWTRECQETPICTDPAAWSQPWLRRSAGLG